MFELHRTAKFATFAKDVCGTTGAGRRYDARAPTFSVLLHDVNRALNYIVPTRHSRLVLELRLLLPSFFFFVFSLACSLLNMVVAATPADAACQYNRVCSAIHLLLASPVDAETPHQFIQ